MFEDDGVNSGVVFALFPGKQKNDIQYRRSLKFIDDLENDQELVDNVTISFVLFCKYLGYTSPREFTLVRTSKNELFLADKEILLEVWYVTEFMYAIGMKGHAYALLLAVCKDMEKSGRLSQFMKTDGRVLFQQSLKSVGIRMFV